MSHVAYIGVISQLPREFADYQAEAEDRELSTHIIKRSLLSVIECISSAKQRMTNATLSGGHHSGTTLFYAIVSNVLCYSHGLWYAIESPANFDSNVMTSHQLQTCETCRPKSKITLAESSTHSAD